MKRKTSYLFLSPNSLMVINQKGKLRTLYTPLRVKCIEAIDGIARGSWVIVEEVRMAGGQLVYLVFGQQLPYRHFKIEISF